MNEENHFIDLGKIEYLKALELQTEMFNQKILKKTKNEEVSSDFFICEHPHVYTLGNSGNDTNLLINEKFLKSVNASYVRTNRGGDITYHGPGQLVIYPIIDLDRYKIGTKEYIYRLEYLIIDLLGKYGLSGEISDGNIGVWLDVGKQNERKICSIGVKVSRGITMHGFALNISTDLSYFNHINPCGFTDKGVSSMEKELNKELHFSVIKQDVLDLINQAFNL
jgi:lipoyl(octanoyl) transferase